MGFGMAMRPERFNAVEEAINAKNAKILLIERISLLSWSLLKNILKFLALQQNLWVKFKANCS